MSKVLLAVGQIVLLVIAGIGAGMLAGQVVGLPASFMPAPEEAQAAGLMALVVQSVYAVLFYFAAVQAGPGGWKLYLALLCVYAGFQIIMTQVETLIFIQAFGQLTAPEVLQMVLNSLLTVAIFVAVLLTVTWRWGSQGAQVRAPATLLNRSLWWKVALLALLYPVIYFGFGYMVAWQFAAVRAYYDATPILYSLPVLALMQVVRGAAWVLFGLPIFLLYRDNNRAILYSVLFYALLPTLVLLYPNPLMPAAVRYPHLLEMITSMALFGWITGMVLVGWRRAPQDMETPRAAAFGGRV